MYINENIRNYLMENGIKQNHLSKKTGIEKNRLSYIVRSKTKLTAEELGAISKPWVLALKFFSKETQIILE